MMPVDLHFGLFTSNFSDEMSEQIATLWLRAMAASNLAWLREHPECPGPYSGEIHYILERKTQHWLPVPELHKQRKVMGPDGLTQAAGGDCKDLATYVVAWYYRLGERMMEQARKRRAEGRPFEKVVAAAKELMSLKVDLVKSSSGFFAYHVRCRWPDGRIEDPSAKLGMNKNGLVELE